MKQAAALMLTALLLTTAAQAVAPVSKTSSTYQPSLLERIHYAKQHTWTCEQRKGLPRTRASTQPVVSASYARWVLQLWSERAKQACA